MNNIPSETAVDSDNVLSSSLSTFPSSTSTLTSSHEHQNSTGTTISPTASSVYRDRYNSNHPSRRIALVTGAAQGIGRGISLRLAQDGYKVALTDLPSQLEMLRELEHEILRASDEQKNRKNQKNQKNHMEAEEGKQNGVDVHVVSEVNGNGLGEARVAVILADVSKEEDVKAMVGKCVVILGGLDVMIANAGIAIYKPLLELPVEDFDKVIAVNLRGAMLCYKHAAQQMVKQGRGGRIIGASSMYGKAGAPNLAGYSASKFGIRGLTHTAALEWGKYGITVNAYAPASIKTPMLDDYDTEFTSTTKGMRKGDFLEHMKGRNPLGYLAGPEEIASLVAYLASPEAHYITGQTISVNGGSLVD